MMDMKKMNQQMIDLYKTTYDNSYNSMMMLQEQMERLGAMYWGQMVSLPEEVKISINEGVPLVKSSPNLSISQELKGLAGHFSEEQEQKREGQSRWHWLRFLKRSK